MKDDLISRKAAIDEISKYASIWMEYDAGMTQEELAEAALNAAKRTMVHILEEMLSAQPKQRWIPCSEGPPEEDHWLGGSGKQFSEKVLVTIVNNDDDDVWVDVTHTVDGEWMLELPRHCKIIAWMPKPEPYREEGEQDAVD